MESNRPREAALARRRVITGLAAGAWLPPMVTHRVAAAAISDPPTGRPPVARFTAEEVPPDETPPEETP